MKVFKLSRLFLLPSCHLANYTFIMSFIVNSTVTTFGGTLYKLTHTSSILKASIDANVFVPPQASKQTVPVLFYLSGLTCTPQNASEKGFLHAWASQHGIAIVFPDTSPRGLSLPGEHDDWDFGSGAGFYVNATQDPWSSHYKMYDYITEELPETVFADVNFKDILDSSRVSITGHSMGGHGALSIFLKNPGKYKSVSAFAPICNPSNCPWGIKAFTGYFGDSEEAKNTLWKQHDATELIKQYKGPTPEILVDVGKGDGPYNQKQLLPENFLEASKGSAYDGNVTIRYHEGYDHAYYFISSFAKDHIEHAAKYLNGTKL